MEKMGTTLNCFRLFLEKQVGTNECPIQRFYQSDAFMEPVIKAVMKGKTLSFAEIAPNVMCIQNACDVIEDLLFLFMDYWCEADEAIYFVNENLKLIAVPKEAAVLKSFVMRTNHPAPLRLKLRHKSNFLAHTSRGSDLIFDIPSQHPLSPFYHYVIERHKKEWLMWKQPTEKVEGDCKIPQKIRLTNSEDIERIMERIRILEAQKERDILRLESRLSPIIPSLEEKKGRLILSVGDKTFVIDLSYCEFGGQSYAIYCHSVEDQVHYRMYPLKRDQDDNLEFLSFSLLQLTKKLMKEERLQQRLR